MADKIFKIIYYIVYAAALFFIGDGIFHNRVKERAKYIITALVYMIVMMPAVLFWDNHIYVVLALNILMYNILFEGNICSQMIHFGGVYLLLNLFESITFGIGTALLLPSLKYSEISDVRTGEISLLFSIGLTGFILFIIKRKRTQEFIIYFRTLNWYQYFVIIMIIWSGILLIGVVTLMPERLFILTLLFLGTALVCVILLVFNVYHKEYYLKQNQIKEQIIHVQQIYFQNIYENDREMRKFRHDVYSQLRCLGLLLEDGKKDEAIKHLQTISGHFEELAIPKYHTGNEILDVIINQRVQAAKDKNITIKLEGKLDKTDFMDTYDLCTIFFNIIDNCMEACDNLHDRESTVKVSILSHGNSVFFQFVNPANEEMYEAVKKRNTTKSDNKNHGFGIENIERVVERNGGEIEYFYNDGKMIVEMYFEN